MIQIVAGDDRILTLTVLDTDGEAADLSGYTIAFQATGGGVTISKATDAGITLLEQSGATLGQAQIVIDSADTADIEQHTVMATEVELTLTATGKKITPVRSSLKVVPQLVT